MQLKYGSYLFPANATLVGIRRSVDDPREPTEETIEFDVEGDLYATGQAACAAAQAALLVACRKLRQNLIFMTDTGATAMALSTVNALAGPNIPSGPNFDNHSGPGVEFVSGRSFRFTAFAVYPVRITGGNAGGVTILKWSESISRTGDGKPQWGHMETMNTKAQKVLLKAFTLYRATQSGQATALLGYPQPPAPIWPAARTGGDGVQVTYTSPTQPGDPFGISWSYQFESVNPLLGLPTFGFIGV